MSMWTIYFFECRDVLYKNGVGMAHPTGWLLAIIPYPYFTKVKFDENKRKLRHGICPSWVMLCSFCSCIL